MALRKLQAEIDKTLKQVSVGVESFEQTFDKLQFATNSTQKDKIETDLKSQIKKLQRVRDQIKTWISSSEIKDKTALIDSRKLIETQMERFKALEKEMKMKAFSKEGLIAQSKLDPAEKAKRDIIDWIGNTNDELSRQIELTEAEAESLNTGRKKKGQGDRLSELENQNERRQWHIARLEVVQRMLENGQLQVEQVEGIQEDVKYFVEANTEEDFEEDEGIYDELNLVDDEDYVGEGTHNDETSNLDSASIADTSEPAPIITSLPKTPAKEDKETTSSGKKGTPASRSVSMSHDKSTPSGTVMDDPSSPVVGKKALRKSTAETKAVAATLTPSDKLPSKPQSTPAEKEKEREKESSTTPAKVVPPPIKYAAAAAAAVASQIPAMPTVPAPIPAEEPPKSDEPLSMGDKDKADAAIAAASKVPPAPESPSKEAQQSNAPPPPPGLVRSPVPAQPPQSTSALTSPSSIPAPPPGISATAPPPLPAGVSAPPGYGGATQGIGAGAGAAASTSVQGESSRAGSSLSAPRIASGSGGTSPNPTSPGQAAQDQGGVMGNLMHSFDMAKELSERRTTDINELNSALDTSYLNAPQLQDAEPPRYYHPKNPIKTPSYYPQTRSPILDDKRLFQRMDIDQLFFIFYYMTGTYDQYVRWLAAQELKRQSWRFHKQYLTWFQRAHNPQAVTSDYEQGGYYYFDWENSWCQRKKSDFRFEYRWLSDD